jgi:branched-chain amino acid transport system substrate-binding protein
MQRIVAGALLFGLMMAPPVAVASEIGLAAPLSGPYARLGEQLKTGVTAAGSAVEIADDGCSAEGGKAAANALLAAEVKIVVGFVCTEALETALPVLSAAGVPVITPAVRATQFADTRSRTGFLFYRLAPRADSDATATAAILRARWGNEPFAILDDGAPANRTLAESFRLAMEANGPKAVLAESYRPGQESQLGIVKRVLGADAAHVFVAGERADIAVIAASYADYREHSAALVRPLEIAAGETLRAAPDGIELPGDVLMIAPPDWSQEGDAAALAAIRAGGAEPDGYAVPAYAAAQIALAALAAGGDLADVLSATAFQTAVGPVTFDEKGEWAESRWELFISSLDKFVLDH